MNTPKLRRNGVTELELPQIQNNYDLNWRVAESDEEALDGTLRTDVSFLKNGFIIYYDAITKTEYDALASFIKTAIASAQTMEFQFDKVTEYETYTECKARLSEAVPFRGGSGVTNFYVSCQLIIKEVNAR